MEDEITSCFGPGRLYLEVVRREVSKDDVNFSVKENPRQFLFVLACDLISNPLSKISHFNVISSLESYWTRVSHIEIVLLKVRC